MTKFYVVPKKKVAMEIENEVINSKTDAIKHFEDFMVLDMNRYFEVLIEEEYKKSEYYKEK